MAHPVLITSLAGFVALAVSCGSQLPAPRIGPHPANATEYVEVPYPPPPARAEVVTPQPQSGAVWIDGEWTWQGRRWTWESGGWVSPPDGSYFAPWVAERLENGKLLWAPGSWHTDDGKEVPKPAFLAAPGGTQARTRRGCPDAGASDATCTAP